jgi:hypothetical protein
MNFPRYPGVSLVWYPYQKSWMDQDLKILYQNTEVGLDRLRLRNAVSVHSNIQNLLVKNHFILIEEMCESLSVQNYVI